MDHSASLKASMASMIRRRFGDGGRTASADSHAVNSLLVTADTDSPRLGLAKSGARMVILTFGFDRAQGAIAHVQALSGESARHFPMASSLAARSSGASQNFASRDTPANSPADPAETTRRAALEVVHAAARGEKLR